MKLLLILAAVMLGVWLWRSQRSSRPAQPPATRPPQAHAAPQDMVACRQCATHVPVADAVAGKRGSYCSTEHLNQSEP